MAPSVRYNVDEWTWRLSLAHYSGGIIIGALWLAVYLVLFIFNKYAHKSVAYWAVGAFVAVFAFGQIGQGMIEGAFHDQYVSRNPITITGQMLAYLAGLGAHFGVTRLAGPRGRSRRKRFSGNVE